MRRISFSQLLLLVFVLAFFPATEARGQEATETEGTPDFRNPPLLSNGVYEDEIVTGEAVWYSVIYRNDEPYRIAVDLVDTDVDADEDLQLEATFIGPTLGSVSSGRVLEGSAGYDGGTTNLWYIQVALATEDRLGVEHTLRLDISGVQTTRLAPCDALPDCDLEDRMDEINSEIQEVETLLAELDVVDSEQAIREEISDLEQRRTTAESELAAAEDSIAAICEPESDCDSAPIPEPTTPVWALVLGGLVLVCGAGFLVMGLRGGRP